MPELASERGETAETVPELLSAWAFPTGASAGSEPTLSPSLRAPAAGGGLEESSLLGDAAADRTPVPPTAAVRGDMTSVCTAGPEDGEVDGVGCPLDTGAALRGGLAEGESDAGATFKK